MDGCRRGGYHAVFFLVDQDDDACVGAVKGLFDEKVLAESGGEVQMRFVHLCVAKREFEAWLLADPEAIQQVLPRANYSCSEHTDGVNAERILVDLLRLDRGAGVGFRKPAFAREMALPFSSQRAIQWSHSFAYFWQRISAAALDS